MEENKQPLAATPQAPAPLPLPVTESLPSEAAPLPITPPVATPIEEPPAVITTSLPSQAPQPVPAITTQKSSSVLIIIISLLMLGLVSFVGFSVYHKINTSTVKKTTSAQLKTDIKEQEAVAQEIMARKINTPNADATTSASASDRLSTIYTNDQYGFSITTPLGWETIEVDPEMTPSSADYSLYKYLDDGIFKISFVESAKESTSSAYFTLKVFQNTDSTTLAAWNSDFLAEFTGNVTVTQNNEEFTIADLPAYKYSLSSPASFPAPFEERYALVSDKYIYTFAYAQANSDYQVDATHSQIFDTMIQSFKLN